MNKYFSAALYCGLLLSGGKAFSAGTDLLERLSNEKIIDNGSTNPFIASEATKNPSDATPQKAKPARSSTRAVAGKNDKAVAVDQAKLSRLTEALRQANATITGLDKQLSAVESEKALLEQAVAHEKERVAEKEQALSRLKAQPDGSAQKLAVESLIATLPKPAVVDQQKNAELAEQLSAANAQRAALTKSLSELQAQKDALDSQLSALKANSAQTTGTAKELDALKAQLSALNLQKATLETRLAEQEKVFSNDKEKLLKELTDLQTQKKALDAQLAKLKASSDKSSGVAKELDALKSQLSALNLQKATLETRLAEQAKLFSSEKTKSEIAQSQLEDAKKVIASQESLLAVQKSSAGSDKEKLLKELTDLQTQKKALDTQLASLKDASAKNATLTKELTELQTQKKALDTQLTALKAANEKSATLAKELTDLQTQKKALETELAALKETREKNAALTKELADLQTQKKALDAQLATLKTSSDKSTGAVKEADALKAQLSALNLQKATLETQLAEQEKLLKSEKFKSDIAQNQLEDAKKVIASQESLLALQKNNAGSEKDKSGALVAQLATAGKETEELKKQLTLLQTQKASLEEQQKTQSASLATLTAENQKLKESQAAPAKEGADKQRIKIDKTAAKDTLTSYAIGTWYGDAAGREKSKLNGLNKKFDQKAFMQGFNDKVTNKLQLAPAALSKELAALDQVQKKQFAATQSENEKQSKAIMTKAANEKGAKRLPDGAIYRVIQQGEAPLITAQNEIITELDEVLGTGKVMSSKEVRASRVKDLPPLFQTVVKKLGLGGEAKLHIPAKQAYGEAGVPGFVPPGTVSIITIKVIGIK